MELSTQLEICNNLGYLSEEEHSSIQRLADEEVNGLLNGLIFSKKKLRSSSVLRKGDRVRTPSLSNLMPLSTSSI